jgi:hypothetical protein
MAPRPIAVVDYNCQRYEGLSQGMRGDVGLLTVPGYRRPAYGSAPVLAAHHASRAIVGVDRLHGFQHLHLFVLQRAGRERVRRLHAGQGQKLNHVVRNHIPQGVRVVVVAAAALHSGRLRDGDLDMVDIAADPDRLEDTVGETEHHDVLKAEK